MKKSSTRQPSQLSVNEQRAAQGTQAPYDLELFAWYRAMRETRPVVRDPRWRGWMVFTHADVQRVLSDHEAFSVGVDQAQVTVLRHSLRNLVTRTFTPRAVEALRPRITQIVEELLDRVAPRGGMDVIEDLAVPLPVIVIAELIGIPIEHRERFKRWSNAVLTGRTAGMSNAGARHEMAVFFTDLMEERRRAPREDLLSRLLAAGIDESLDQRELLSFCVLLLVAGNETTTNLIGNTILCLAEHPEAEVELRAHPELLPSAVEEILRYRSPVQSMFRVTTTDVRLGDQAVPAGQSVVAWIGSANRDPRQFPNPDRFDIRRSRNRHLAFGHGIHFCLGAPLARLEATVALGALLGRLGRLRVDRAAVEPLSGDLLHGVRRLPVTFTTGR